MIVARIGDDQLAGALLPGLDLHRSPDLLGQLLFEARDVAVGADPAPGLGRGMKNRVDQVFRLPHRKAAQDDALCHALLPAPFERQQGARVAHLELAVEDHRLHRLLQIAQPEQVGGGGPRAADRLGGFLMGELELLDQPLHPIRLLEGVEILALDVLDQRHGERRGVGHLAHQHRHLLQSRDLRGTPAPLSGDDFVAAVVDRPYQDRLHQSLLAYGRGQFLERGVVHLRARLVAAALQLVDAQHGLMLGRRLAVGVPVEQSVQAPAQPPELHGATAAERPLRVRTSPTRST